jgi:hypothetical protein
MSDGLVFEAVKFGRALADICTRVNRRQIEAIEAKLAEEVGEKLAKKAAEIKAKTKRQSYDADTVYANGAESLRKIMAEQSEDPKLTDAMIQGLEYGFTERREEARVGRRRLEASLRKRQPGDHANAATCITSNT